VERFAPDHLGKLNFYLEALDRDVREPHENPAIGVLLCAGNDSDLRLRLLRLQLGFLSQADQVPL
jgi:hypothetical protein